MTVDPAKTPHHADHESKTWHFCSAGCRSKFMADPEQYLTDRGDQSVETGPGTVWTCPMPPATPQDPPGACPICGMALEPAMVRADSRPSARLKDMSLPSGLELGPSLLVIFLAMGCHLIITRAQSG